MFKVIVQIKKTSRTFKYIFYLNKRGDIVIENKRMFSDQNPVCFLFIDEVNDD